MIMLPIIVNLRIDKPDNRDFRLWLPIFLIWPFVLALLLGLAPLILLISIILWPFGKGRRLLFAAPMILYILCNFRGTLIDITGAEEKVFIRIE